MDFKRFINRIRDRPGSAENIKYFRFDAPTNKKTFNLDDYKKMPLLKEITTAWLDQEKVKEKIGGCAKTLIAP
ncbi:hypothetical protein V498_07837 [Pseudogymnoascus sp. VKM F-4517 (FW-2822)]|nr:hypothetical protein V498_07837 [Pseudogymnoascus sp. VKM F-4517 (FW-2822)]